MKFAHRLGSDGWFLVAAVGTSKSKAVFLVCLFKKFSRRKTREEKVEVIEKNYRKFLSIIKCEETVL
jgi:hypothetical protein